MIYRCELVFRDSMRLVQGKDAVFISFLFKLTPKEAVGRPDEKRFVLDRSIRLQITGPCRAAWGILDSDEDTERILYWYAVDRCLPEEINELSIDTSFSDDCPCDIGRISYPPESQFDIEIPDKPPKMGFRT